MANDQQTTGNTFEQEYVPQGAERMPGQPEQESAARRVEHGKETAQERSGAERDSAYQNILQKVQNKTASDDTGVPQDAQTLGDMQDRERQVQHLMDLAITKGVVHAVKVARHTEDFYVLDQLHDRMLADDFHDALMEKGLLVEE